MRDAVAALYGVTPKRLNEQVRRNRGRFPVDFAFVMTINDLRTLRLQSASSSWGGRRYAQIAYSEHGTIMAATVLNSPRAVAMSVYVVRSFMRALMAQPAPTSRPIGFTADIAKGD